MTFNQWVKRYKEIPVINTKEMKAIKYGTNWTDKQKWNLWHLSDYVVTTVAGGTIWLMPNIVTVYEGTNQ